MAKRLFYKGVHKDGDMYSSCMNFGGFYKMNDTVEAVDADHALWVTSDPNIAKVYERGAIIKVLVDDKDRITKVRPLKHPLMRCKVMKMKVVGEL
jgi:hypothetical protein